MPAAPAACSLRLPVAPVATSAHALPRNSFSEPPPGPHTPSRAAVGGQTRLPRVAAALSALLADLLLACGFWESGGRPSAWAGWRGRGLRAVGTRQPPDRMHATGVCVGTGAGFRCVAAASVCAVCAMPSPRFHLHRFGLPIFQEDGISGRRVIVHVLIGNTPAPSGSQAFKSRASSMRRGRRRA